MTSGTGAYSSLATSPRVEALRDRHLEYYADLAEQGDDELYKPDVAAWNRLLDSEYDNITQALDRASETGRETAALHLANIIYCISAWRGDFTPAGPWLEQALVVGATASGPRAQALLDLGDVVFREYDRPRAWQLAQEALVVARQGEDKKFEAGALRRLGETFGPEVGGVEAAAALLEQALEAARQTGNELEVAHALFTLARRKTRNDPEGCRRDYQSALDTYRRVGDIGSAAWIGYHMAWAQPDPVKAQGLADEALKMARDIEDQMMIICVLDLMGWLAEARGDCETALEIFETTLQEFRQPGRKWPLWWAVRWQLDSASFIEIEKGELDKARARNEEALQIALEHRSKPHIRASKSALGRTIAFQGDHAKGTALAEEAVALARELGQGLGYALRTLGDVCLVTKDLRRARSAYEEALSILRDALGSLPDIESLQGMAAVATADGRLDEASAHLEEALELARRPSSVSLADVVQTALAKVARLKGELEESDRLSAAAVSALAEKRHMPNLAAALEERAALASARGDTERAAKIFGSVAALREQIGIPVWPLARSDFEAELDRVKTALGSGFQRAFDEGRRADLEEALRLVL